MASPARQNQSLTITKVATESGFSAVNDLIHYTIPPPTSSTLFPYTTLFRSSEVTDLVCSPTTPVTDLAPGDSIDCTASHTIVQADLDAGHFYNQACTDDGTSTRLHSCHTVNSQATPNPRLTITKVATESGFSAVNDVIHYTITATNNGNVTLHNVVVTDSEVTDLVSPPLHDALPISPGDSIDCTASHTIVQADLDAGHFYNQACT